MRLRGECCHCSSNLRLHFWTLRIRMSKICLTTNHENSKHINWKHTQEKSVFVRQREIMNWLLCQLHRCPRYLKVGPDVVNCPEGWSMSLIFGFLWWSSDSCAWRDEEVQHKLPVSKMVQVLLLQIVSIETICFNCFKLFQKSRFFKFYCYVLIVPCCRSKK